MSTVVFQLEEVSGGTMLTVVESGFDRLSPERRAQLAAVPVMLVTNYAEHQKLALAAGAEAGFGKQELRDPKTIEKLAQFLS